MAFVVSLVGHEMDRRVREYARAFGSRDIRAGFVVCSMVDLKAQLEIIDPSEAAEEVGTLVVDGHLYWDTHRERGERDRSILVANVVKEAGFRDTPVWCVGEPLPSGGQVETESPDPLNAGFNGKIVPVGHGSSPYDIVAQLAEMQLARV